MPIDRARLEPAFREYTSCYSSEGEAISLETSLHLLNELRARRVERALDLGSGWSSYLLRLYKKVTAPALEVWSLDDNEQWLGTTARFLARHDLDTSNLRLWPRLGDRPFDLVFYDMGRPGDRHLHLDRVLDATAGVLICSDMHVDDYRRRVDAFARGQALRLDLLRDETRDGVGRFAGRIARQRHFS
jgi:hypothetical protein